jgi:hypothetical protein
LFDGGVFSVTGGVVSDFDGVAVAVAGAVSLGVTVGLGVSLEVGVSDGVRVSLGVGVLDSDGLSEGVGLSLVGVGVGVQLLSWLGDSLGEWLGS